MIQLTPEQWDRLQSLPKPRCPRDISPEAKAIWKATAPGLKRKGHLTFVDCGLFTQYCLAVARHRRSVRALQSCSPRNRKAYATVERLSRHTANSLARMFYLPRMKPLKGK